MHQIRFRLCRRMHFAFISIAQPPICRCMKLPHRLKADEMPIETLGRNRRSAAAYKWIKNCLALLRRQIYQERYQSDGLLGFMDSLLLFHEPELENICRANPMSLACLNIHRANSMFQDVVRNGAAYAIGLHEPGNGARKSGPSFPAASHSTSPLPRPALVSRIPRLLFVRDGGPISSSKQACPSEEIRCLQMRSPLDEWCGAHRIRRRSCRSSIWGMPSAPKIGTILRTPSRCCDLLETIR